MVFAVATMSDETRQGIDFFPLTIDYEERMYAGGRIPGSFFRREGRPSEESILTARLTDRPLRPLFPKDMHNEVQIILYSFSVDGENPIDILAINAASAALMISGIPFDGPVGALRIGYIDGKFVLNPTFAELEASVLDLRMAGTRDAILMVECGANEVSEAIMIDALEFGHKAIQPIVELQEQMAAQIGKPKRTYEPYKIDEELWNVVIRKSEEPLNAMLDLPHEKTARDTALNELRNHLTQELSNEDETLALEINIALDEALKRVVRSRILERGLRPDGRGTTGIRDIWCEVDVNGFPGQTRPTSHLAWPDAQFCYPSIPVRCGVGRT